MLNRTEKSPPSTFLERMCPCEVSPVCGDPEHTPLLLIVCHDATLAFTSPNGCTLGSEALQDRMRLPDEVKVYVEHCVVAGLMSHAWQPLSLMQSASHAIAPMDPLFAGGHTSFTSVKPPPPELQVSQLARLPSGLMVKSTQ
jgi:hypothetical protein